MHHLRDTRRRSLQPGAPGINSEAISGPAQFRVRTPEEIQHVQFAPAPLGSIGSTRYSVRS
eukprot:15470712-Alexandrium_andersonii.AAC.1